MMRSIKIILGFLLMILFVNITFAQNTTSCSSTKRDIFDATSESYMNLFSLTDVILQEYIKKTFNNFNLTQTINGDRLRYDNNKGGCNNLGSFVIGLHNSEVNNRNSFRIRYSGIASGITNGPVLSQGTVTSMQNYIRNYCGFNMGIDGKLGKKTLNSINICKPPAMGYLLRDTFKSMYTKLYTDVGGKNMLYTGGAFVGDPSGKLFFKQTDFPSQQVSNGLGLVIENTSNTNSADICRASLLSSVEELIYKSMLPNLNIDKKCCYKGPKLTLPPLSQTTIPAGWEVTSTTATFTPTTMGPQLLIPSIPICTDTDLDNKSPVCRFDNASTLDVSKYYTNQTKEIIVPGGTCKDGCPSGSIEKKTIQNGKKISFCEKCNIDSCNCGIKLNTSIPFIGRCIMTAKTNNVGQSGGGTTVNTLNAFPILMGALIKLLMSIIMLVCFGSLIVGGFMMTVPDQYETGKSMVKKVIRTIIALGSLGTILYLINPNFFS